MDAHVQECQGLGGVNTLSIIVQGRTDLKILMSVVRLEESPRR